MSNVETVQALYQAFGSGDIPAILERIHDNVVWEDGGRDIGVPWLRPGTGRDHVASFFESLGALEFHGFEPLNFLHGGDQVAVPVKIDATVKSTGKRIAETEIHLWTFSDDGKVSRFRHHLDTAMHIEASSD